MTVDTLLDSMTVNELFKWFMFYNERQKEQDKSNNNEPIQHDWENMDSSQITGAFGL